MDINYTSKQGVFRTHIVELDFDKLSNSKYYQEDFLDIIEQNSKTDNFKFSIINNSENIYFLPEWVDGITIEYRLSKYSKHLGFGKILSGNNGVLISNLGENWFFSGYPNFNGEQQNDGKVSSYESFLKTLFLDEDIKGATEYAFNNYKYPVSMFPKEKDYENHFRVFLEDVVNWTMNPQKDSKEYKLIESLKEGIINEKGLKRLSFKLAHAIKESMNSHR